MNAKHAPPRKCTVAIHLLHFLIRTYLLLLPFGEEFTNPGQGQEEKQHLVHLVMEAGVEKALLEHLSQGWGLQCHPPPCPLDV